MSTRTVKWLGEKDFLGTNRDNRGVLMSVGDGPGVGPMEMLLFGLAGCGMYDVVGILEKQKQPLSGLEVRVDGERGEEGARPYKKISLHFIFTGNVDPKRAERAIQLSTEKYCGVHATLSASANITTTYEIIEQSNKE